MTDQLPPPPVPADCDLRDLQWMPLDVVRLRDSDLAATPDGEAFRVAVLSWCASWHQVPAASLPDDDLALARLLGFGRDVRGWKKARAAGGLRGWTLHSDGRLYHPVVAEKALEALGQKRRASTKRERDAERLKRWRDGRDETRSCNAYETSDETRFVAERQDQTRHTGPDIPDQTYRTGPCIPTPPPPGSPREAGADAPAPPGGERRRITGIRPAEVYQAVAAGDLTGLVKAFGGSTPASAEWARDAAGMQLGELAAVLWLAMREGSPIRQPSGLRRARQAWGQEPPEERRAIATQAAEELGIPGPRAQVEVLT